MDFSSDEIRRQTRESQREHEAAMASIDAALEYAFDPATATPQPLKDDLLGLSSRRGLLRVGGATIGLAALAAACVPASKKTQVPQSGMPATTTEAPATTLPPGTPELDATLVLTALSIEYTAVAAYQTAIDSGLVTNAAIGSAAAYFQQQHRDHAGALAGVARSLGQEPTEDPNQVLVDNILTPRAAAARDQQAILQIALALEDLAAQTYVRAGGLLTVPPLRQTAMSIGGVEARHVIVLRAATFAQEFPDGALYPTGGAAPRSSYLEPKVDTIPSTTAPTTEAPTTTTTSAKPTGTSAP
jgi:hypothetical protein